MSDTVEAFIARWQGKEGGAERANYALFLSELCVLDRRNSFILEAKQVRLWQLAGA